MHRRGRLLHVPRLSAVGAHAAPRGLHGVNVANNHAMDFGTEAQRETLKALRDAGIVYQGLPGQIAYVRAGRGRSG